MRKTEAEPNGRQDKLCQDHGTNHMRSSHSTASSSISSDFLVQLPFREIPTQLLTHLHHEMQNKTILMWNYKGLKVLPPSLIEEGTHIQQIYLKHNLLMKLPDNLGCLRCLTFLYLYGNNLEEISESIGDIRTLQVLDVSNNKLQKLPVSLSYLKNLRSLVVAHNEISSIPSELGNLKALSLLILSGNRLNRLPESLGNLKALQGLYIDCNLLTILPHTLACLPLLAHFSCCYNYLVNLPSKPFACQPTLFFDNNQELNYLPFSLLRNLKLGDSYEPFVVPSCGCFQGNPVVNKTVFVELRKVSADTSIISLPPELKSVSFFHNIGLKLNALPLMELCLRYLWTHKDLPCFKQQLAPGFLPETLFNTLNEGPVAFCEFCQKTIIFLHAIVIVITVCVAPQSGVNGKEIPTIIYFCSDSCANLFHHKTNSLPDDYSLWLQRRLASQLKIKFSN